MKQLISTKQGLVVASSAAISVFLAIGVFIYFYIKNRKSSSMKLSESGLKELKSYESLKLTAYQDQGGVWTIGYGHTKNVKSGDNCTQTQAEEWLREDVYSAEKTVISETETLILTQNQFDALVIFCYNVGNSAFKNSTLLKKVKANPNDTSIADEFKRWIYVKGVVSNGLVNRRQKEINIYYA